MDKNVQNLSVNNIFSKTDQDKGCHFEIILTIGF